MSTAPAVKASAIDTTDLVPKKLDGFERTALKDCEAKIERGLKTFYEVASGLLEIRESKLYREGFESFEDYCRERWGFARNYANKLIAASKTIEALGTNVPKPVNEAQARELAKAPEDQRVEVWSEVVEQAGGVERVTAAKVREVVQQRLQPDPHDEDGGAEDLGLEPGDADLGPDTDQEPAVDDEPAPVAVPTTVITAKDAKKAAREAEAAKRAASMRRVVLHVLRDIKRVQRLNGMKDLEFATVLEDYAAKLRAKAGRAK